MSQSPSEPLRTRSRGSVTSLFFVAAATLAHGCALDADDSSEETDVVEDALAACAATPDYNTCGNQIYLGGKPTQFRGTNMWGFRASVQDTAGPARWGAKIVRQVIDMKTTSDAKIDALIADAHSRGIVTILDAHYFDCACDGDAAEQQEAKFAGKDPSKTPFYAQVKSRWRSLATRHKNKPYVWFGLWNEPWGEANKPTADGWRRQMAELVDNIRSTGAQNIILVPSGGNFAQEIEAIKAQGRALLNGRKNLVFEIHAYSRWLKTTPTSMADRIGAVLAVGPMIFGEFATTFEQFNDVQPLINVLEQKKVSALAWIWDCRNAVASLALPDCVTPNNNGNLNFGSKVKAFLARGL